MDPTPPAAAPEPTADRDRLAEVERALLRRWPETRLEPSLDRISALVRLLGDPQRAYPVVHVAGTNGKTSTARMVESLLRAFGVRTGLYTSPHLQHLSERVRLDGAPVDAARLVAAYDELAPYLALVDAGGVPLSFFETLTGLAFAVFADAPADVAVVEVGMGGTWDATNVADAAVAVVTPVGLDHTEYLGATLAEIAAEKAGILKPGCTAVLGPQEPAAAAVLRARAAEVGAEVVQVGTDVGADLGGAAPGHPAGAAARADVAVTGRRVAVGGQELRLRTRAGEYDEVFLPLFGAHQALNAAAALAAVESLLGGASGALAADRVREGFAAATSPGRLEVARTRPTVLLDAAHNPAGARALAAALEESFDLDHLVAVVGVLGGKDAAGILAELSGSVSAVVATACLSPRALPARELGRIAADVLGADRVVVRERLDDAIDAGVQLAEEGGGLAGVLVTGSVVTVGQARTLLLGGPSGGGPARDARAEPAP